VNIRTFERGDAAAQVAIYNEATADLPKFKPATLDEVRRRQSSADFDPSSRFVAVENGKPVGYFAAHANGRVSFPWCRKGQESCAEPLFEHGLQHLRASGRTHVFAAYRADWTAQGEFFLAHGFAKARDMVNFVIDLVDLPTPAMRSSSSITPLEKRDIPSMLRIAPQVLRVHSQDELQRHCFDHAYLTPEQFFVCRSRTTNQPVAVGVLIANADYADPEKVDADMPCFRLGAFGTEGMQTKRIRGLFSLLAANDRDFSVLALDLLAEAARRLHTSDIEVLAAQVPSDASHLLRFYQQYFRRQGSFPVFERSL
jgi:hypothetical protein